MSEIDLSSPLNYGTPSSLGSVRTPRSGIRGTPIRMRPDVRSDKRIRQVNIASDPVCIYIKPPLLLLKVSVQLSHLAIEYITITITHKDTIITNRNEIAFHGFANIKSFFCWPIMFHKTFSNVFFSSSSTTFLL